MNVLTSFFKRHQEFIRFGLVGISNTFVHAVIVIMLMEVFLPPAYFANMIAFFFANVFSYVLNSRYTFRKALSFYSYWRFLAMSLVSLGLTVAVTFVFEYLGFHYIFGLLAVIFVVPVINYTFMKIWVFSREF